jgi:hypothetical protein
MQTVRVDIEDRVAWRVEKRTVHRTREREREREGERGKVLNDLKMKVLTNLVPGLNSEATQLF